MFLRWIVKVFQFQVQIILLSNRKKEISMILNKGNWLEILYSTIDFVNTSQTLSHFLNRNTVKVANKNIGEFLWWNQVYYSSTGMSFYIREKHWTSDDITILILSTKNILNSTFFQAAWYPKAHFDRVQKTDI